MKPVGVRWVRLQKNTPQQRKKGYIPITTLGFMASVEEGEGPWSLVVHQPAMVSSDEEIPPPVKARPSARSAQAKPKAAEQNVLLVAGLVTLFMAPIVIVVYGILPDEEVASMTNVFLGAVVLGFVFLMLGMLIRPPQQQAHPRSMWIEPAERSTSLYDQASLEANIHDGPTTMVFHHPPRTEQNDEEGGIGRLPSILLAEGTGTNGENVERPSNHHRSDGNTGPAVVGWVLVGVFVMISSIVGGSEAILCGGFLLLDAVFLTAFLPNQQDRKPANGLQNTLAVLMLLMALIFIIVFSS